MPENGIEPLFDSDDLTLTVVVRLPQRLDRIVALLHVIGEEFPHGAFVDGLARLEIPADDD